MPPERTSTVVRCEACHATVPRDAERCWLCQARLDGNAAAAVVDTSTVQPEVRAGSVGSFSLASLMMFVTLAAVVLGLSTIAPGIGIPLGVVMLVAWLRTAAVLHYRPSHRRSTSQIEKLHLFFASFGFSLVLIALAAVIAIASIVAGFFACMGTVAGFGDSLGNATATVAFTVWWVAGLAIAIPAFWWIGKRMAKMIRRRWRRDIGKPDEPTNDEH